MKVEKLMAGLNHWDPKLREEACVALGQSDDARAVGPLIARLSGDVDWRVRQRAGEALGRLGDAAAVPALLEQLRTEDSGVRRAACEALGRLADGRTVEPLMAALEDSSALVRSAACLALAALGDSRSVEPLMRRLADKVHGVRCAACEAAGKLKDARLIEALIGRLDDAHPDVRLAACEALSGLGEMRAVEPLLSWLWDPRPRVRQSAAQALERLGEGRLAWAAVAALNGQADGAAALAAVILEGRLRALDILVQISAARNHPHGSRARKALDAVWKAVGPRAGELLCSGCLARPEANRPVCRVCGQAKRLVLGVLQVVAVLDDDWPDEWASAPGTLRVNWLKRRAVFDFDRVEIVAATDEEVERFLIQVGNDTDEWRQKRYKNMICTVAPQCTLTENTLRILRGTLGGVTRA